MDGHAEHQDPQFAGAATGKAGHLALRTAAEDHSGLRGAEEAEKVRGRQVTLC